MDQMTHGTQVIPRIFMKRTAHGSAKKRALILTAQMPVTDAPSSSRRGYGQRLSAL